MKENLKLNCGILKEDIKPILDAATEKDVIIMFRSTGPYARPWLEQGYPSKNFHIKGKTSNLGFIAGLVPFQGTFSKVWWDNNSAKKCDEANQKAIVDGYAKKEPFIINEIELTNVIKNYNDVNKNPFYHITRNYKESVEKFYSVRVKNPLTRAILL